MKNNLGLKLWSHNQNYILPAKQLYEAGHFDYIELYALPNTTDFLPKWQSLKDELEIPFAIHAPHFSHSLDFSNKSKRESNEKMADEAFFWAKNLDAFYTLFHPGIGGSVDESIYQISRLRQKYDFIIENKPFIVPTKDKKELFCVGSKFSDLEKITAQTGVKICLDIGHAICSANYQGLEIYGYLELLNSLNPAVYHLSDNDSTSVFDAHLNFGKGSFDFEKIAKIIDKNKPIAIETNKNSSENLDDFVKDSNFLKGILCKM